MKRHPHLVRNFVITYLGVTAALSVFALWPSLALGEFSTLLITMYWMMVLAAIVSSYAVIVVTFGGEHEEPAERTTTRVEREPIARGPQLVTDSARA